VGLRVVGAGFPRTGTRSLKAALERLLGGACYHMQDVFENLDHVPTWRRAFAGESPEWHGFLSRYVAVVDWPASALWPELSAAYPDAVVLLSTRMEPNTWWRSADRTILGGARRQPPPDLAEWQKMYLDLLERFIPEWTDERAANEAYERHNAAVRAAVPPGRLLEWQAADGWEPLCRALGTAVPDEPFPHFAGVHPRVDVSPAS
jgi:Sulfotransferase domain